MSPDGETHAGDIGLNIGGGAEGHFGPAFYYPVTAGDIGKAVEDAIRALPGALRGDECLGDDEVIYWMRAMGHFPDGGP